MERRTLVSSRASQVQTEDGMGKKDKLGTEREWDKFVKDP